MSNGITFWGVRGSVAAPGPSTAGVGGNTTCSEVSLGQERILVDGGTGLRALGAAWGPRPMKAAILFSHLHWDHIQGVPFFGPLYHPQSSFLLVGPEGLRAALQAQMSRPSFPVGMEVMAGRLEFREIAAGDRFELGAVSVATAALNHPGGAIAYRLEHEGLALVHALDHEHGDREADQRLLELARGAELLVYDGQYLPEEYPAKAGWGHSTYEQGVELARRAGVRRLALAHHDPLRTDREVAGIEARARRRFAGAVAACEGRPLALFRASRSPRLKAS